jgi:hypothetical protein
VLTVFSRGNISEVANPFSISRHSREALSDKEASYLLYNTYQYRWLYRYLSFSFCNIIRETVVLVYGNLFSQSLQLLIHISLAIFFIFSKIIRNFSVLFTKSTWSKSHCYKQCCGSESEIIRIFLKNPNPN